MENIKNQKIHSYKSFGDYLKNAEEVFNIKITQEVKFYSFIIDMGTENVIKAIEEKNENFVKAWNRKLEM